MFLRHLAAFLALPFVVAVVVPVYLARRYHVLLRWPEGTSAMLAVIAGALVLLAGLALFVASIHEFVTRGRGTLAPWDPPRALVVRGPYQYVRNPMISGVTLLLIAEALLLRSLPHAEWAGTFAMINAIYIPLLEEPQLAGRFGDAYREYCRHVPRLIPRLSPWRSGS
jgi:protein-S-isoprenylcysteine O-methyltransferase Ste14